jgi:hypothetical protein
MAGLSNNYENIVLDTLFGAVRSNALSTVVPGTIYLALINTAAGSINDDGATGTTEVSGTSYARVALDNDGLDGANAWRTAASGQKKNINDIVFPTAGGAWTTANSWMLLTNNSAIATTNVICWGAITTPQTLASGQTASFVVDALVISAD